MSNQLRFMKINLAERHTVDWLFKEMRADQLENLMSDK